MESLAPGLRRAALYRLAAEAVSHPEPARLDQMCERADRCLAVARPGGELAGPLAAFREALRDVTADELQEEYVRLFDRQVACSPYETAYGDGRRMAGKSAELADVAGFYAAFGLEPSDRQPDMQDHIAAELEFMSALALKESFAIACGLGEPLAVTRRAEVLFLGDHLARWAGAFAKRLAGSTASPYYQAAAALVERLVEADARDLGVEAAPVAEVSPPDPMQGETFACPLAGEEPR